MWFRSWSQLVANSLAFAADHDIIIELEASLKADKILKAHIEAEFRIYIYNKVKSSCQHSTFQLDTPRRLSGPNPALLAAHHDVVIAVWAPPLGETTGHLCIHRGNIDALVLGPDKGRHLTDGFHREALFVVPRVAVYRARRRG